MSPLRGLIVVASVLLLFCGGAVHAVAPAAGAEDASRHGMAAGGPRVACFGDSWAAFACDTLQKVFELNLHFNEVKNVAVSGSTAHFWATHTDDYLAVLAEADPNLMWLSIGGDDILGYYRGNAGNMSYINTMIAHDLTTMLTELTHLYPDIQVVMFGYDFVNFVQSPLCEAYGQNVFGNRTTEEINEIFLSYAANVLVPVTALFDQVTYAPEWGTLQAAMPKGIPPPYPNVEYPSPAPLMNDGCIHASKEGWMLLMSKLYKDYFQSRL